MRKEIMDIIISHQQELVDNLNKSQETYETSTDLDEESVIELDDLSHQADTQDLKMKMNEKLKMEQDDLSQITSLRMRDATEIQNGAIVETKEAIYFIGFTFAPIQSEKMKIFGVSLEAPVFENNKGKKKGDDLILGEDKHKILNVY